jgi:hypothetical protein
MPVLFALEETVFENTATLAVHIVVGIATLDGFLQHPQIQLHAGPEEQ